MGSKTNFMKSNNQRGEWTTRDELVSRISDGLGWRDSRVLEAIELFSLGPRSNFLEPPPGMSPGDVYPWRFNRALSYLRRPLILRRGQSGPEILWGDRHLETARENLLSLCLTGRLKARSGAMRAFIGKRRNKQGKDFNDSVADTLRDSLKLPTKRRVRKIGKLRFDNLGDIDVLAADASRKHIIVLECKDLSVARTPHELLDEVTHLLYGDRKHRSVVAKHEDRIRWVREHMSEVLKFFEIPARTGWRVVSYIVVDEALITPHLLKCPIAVLSLEQLKKGLP